MIPSSIDAAVAGIMYHDWTMAPKLDNISAGMMDMLKTRTAACSVPVTSFDHNSDSYRQMKTLECTVSHNDACWCGDAPDGDPVGDCRPLGFSTADTTARKLLPYS
jgi:hypothetical protein